MIRRALALLLLLWSTGIAAAQDRLTLTAAIAKARTQSPDVRAAAAAEREAQAGIALARAGYLPTLELSESWQRGNHPVFVFGALLAQRQFGSANFAIDALNHPASVPNVRAALAVEQAVFDPLAVAGIRVAALGRDLASSHQEVVARDVAVTVTSAYGAVLTADAAIRAADSAVAAADADLTRARRRYEAGLATHADVLQVEVFLARAREQRIRSATEGTIARARLNQAMGEQLDATFVLDDTAPPATIAPGDTAALEAIALGGRPDVARAGLHEQLAHAAVTQARAAFLPRVVAQGNWEANGDGWGARASSWTAGVVARVPLFRGGADQARLARARQAATRQAIEHENVLDTVRLDVRIAVARLEAAHASAAVSRATVAQALEGQRIVRDRYDAGLADVTALLRAADAVQQADAAQQTAAVEITMAAAMLARALGQP